MGAGTSLGMETRQLGTYCPASKPATPITMLLKFVNSEKSHNFILCDLNFLLIVVWQESWSKIQLALVGLHQ